MPLLGLWDSHVLVSVWPFKTRLMPSHATFLGLGGVSNESSSESSEIRLEVQALTLNK